MAEEKDSTTTAPPPKPEQKPASNKPVPKPLPQWNVVLIDDNEHTYDYVIGMLGKLFGHGLDRAYQLAKEVDSSGRVIVFTTHKERAELKRDQIMAFGADPLMSISRGSMKAVIEPMP